MAVRITVETFSDRREGKRFKRAKGESDTRQLSVSSRKFSNWNSWETHYACGGLILFTERRSRTNHMQSFQVRVASVIDAVGANLLSFLGECEEYAKLANTQIWFLYRKMFLVHKIHNSTSQRDICHRRLLELMTYTIQSEHKCTIKMKIKRCMHR